MNNNQIFVAKDSKALSDIVRSLDPCLPKPMKDRMREIETANDIGAQSVIQKVGVYFKKSYQYLKYRLNRGRYLRDCEKWSRVLRDMLQLQEAGVLDGGYVVEYDVSRKVSNPKASTIVKCLEQGQSPKTVLAAIRDGLIAPAFRKYE